MKRWITALALVCANEGMAQDLVVDEESVRSCFKHTDVGANFPPCLGQASNQCQALEGGSTTIGISTCIQAETAVWDDILNEEYQSTRGHFANVVGGADTSDSALLLEKLLAAQRAWIGFRDAECDLSYARWKGGSIRSVVYANCHLTMTAARAIELRSMRHGEFQ